MVKNPDTDDDTKEKAINCINDRISFYYMLQQSNIYYLVCFFFFRNLSTFNVIDIYIYILKTNNHLYNNRNSEAMFLKNLGKKHVKAL